MMTDSAIRYGLISRFFHWLMALGLIWMVFTATVRAIDKDSELTKMVFQYHSQMGFTILWLAVLRIIWALLQGKNRPESSALAKLGHWALYLLMAIVPILAMLRTVGGGRAFNYLNSLPILSASEEKTQWMVDLGNNFHGNLGWLLFALIGGHILMVIKHRITGTDVLPRMLGK